MSFSYWFVRDIYTTCKMSHCHLCGCKCLLLYCDWSFQSLYGVFQWIGVSNIKEIMFMLSWCFVLLGFKKTFLPLKGWKYYLFFFFWSFDLVITKLSGNSFCLWCRMSIPFHLFPCGESLFTATLLVKQTIIFLLICFASYFM